MKVLYTSNLRRLKFGEEKKKKKPQDENIMSASATQGGHKNLSRAGLTVDSSTRDLDLDLDLDLGLGHTAYQRASVIDLYLHTKFH